MAEYKTPGVYVEEISKFPPSVAGVATAIPAFIGFTADCPSGQDGKPVKVTSMVDYEAKFGGAPKLEIIQETKGGETVDVIKNNDFVMYDSMRLFYDNGGKTCYVVSVGNYKTDKSDVKADTYKGVNNLVFSNLEKVDEVTLLLFPDAALVLNDVDALGEVQKAALNHCGKMGDRFAILDVKDIEDQNDKLGKTFEKFRDAVGTNNLSYGAAYYPYLKTTYTKEIRFEEMIKDSRIASILYGGYAEDDTEEQRELKKTIVKSYNENIGGLIDYSGVVDEVKKQVENELKEMTDFASQIEKFSVSTEGKLIYGDLNVDSIDQPIVKKIFDILLPKKTADVAWEDILADVKKEMLGEFNTKEKEYEKILSTKAQKKFLFDRFQRKTGTTCFEVTPNGTLIECVVNVDLEIETTRDISEASISSLILDYDQRLMIKRVLDQIKATKTLKEGLAESQPIYSKAIIRLIDQYAASKGNPGYSEILEAYQAQAQVITPSAAIAGIYAMTDANKGVWQAPANVSLSGVSNVMEQLSDGDQESMNVDSNAGKSINAIRFFSGKGIIVWGARTLDGNSNEWRYVPVRRLFNYIEESVQKSTNWAVFQPNDANTWVKVRCQIENFLSNLWRDGALAGSTPDKAFYVRVGLDETMTAQDILEGRMIVEIGLAAVRPAEFIILKFSHKLQEA
ncbi:MAG: phage tail sheath subtilisin-like domain-containing protein [Paludibacteraceae bacterium]|nr:phage tail sheath subtilisin-like domain-containing protein [Paludibacteraceae bacterium]